MVDAGWTPAALLPGALLLAFGWALLAALRRWYDPVPRRIAAAFALLLLLLLAPVLLGGKVLLPLGNLVGFAPFRGLPPPQPPTHAIQGDLVHQITPWQAQVRRALADGRWPLWNEHAGAGMPLMGDPQSQVFQPLVAAALPLTLAAAPGLTAALRLLVALVGMFLLLRKQGLGEAAALCGSGGYGLCGGLLVWLGWPIANAVAWTPLALYAVVRCHRAGGRRDVALLAAASAALLLGGHPETVLQAGGVMGLFVLAFARERHRGGTPVAPFLMRCGGAALLAGLLVAPLLLLQQHYLPQTERAAALAMFLTVPTLEQLLSGWSHLDLWRAWGARVEPQVLSVVALRAYGNHEIFWGEANFVEQGTASVGAAIAVLALAAVVRRRPSLPQEGLMTGLAAVCLLVIAKPPYLARFLGQIPLLGASAVHEHHRLMLLVALAATYVAACEVERWQRGERHTRALVIGALVTAAIILWAYLAHPQPGVPGLSPTQRPWLALQLAVVAAVVGLAWLLGSDGTRWRWARRAAPWALAAVLATEPLALHGGALTPAPARLFYPRLPALQFLERNLGEARLVGIADIFPANFAQLYGLGDLRVDGPARPRAYIELIDPLRERGPVTLASASQLGQPGARLYDLMGVRYVLTPPGHHLGLPVAYRDPTLWIYEHPRPLPRLFLPTAATIYRGGDWTAWFRRPRDFAARALVAAPPPGSDAPRWRARRAVRGSLASGRRDATRWIAHSRAPEGRLLVGSIYQDGGWRLLVDGRPHPTVLANGPLLGAWLPPGPHALDVLYRPQRFAAGCLLAALALAGGLAGLLPPPRWPAGAVAGPREAAP